MRLDHLLSKEYVFVLNKNSLNKAKYSQLVHWLVRSLWNLKYQIEAMFRSVLCFVLREHLVLISFDLFLLRKVEGRKITGQCLLRTAQRTRASSSIVDVFVISKLLRANGECLGDYYRRRTWVAAKSHGEPPTRL